MRAGDGRIGAFDALDDGQRIVDVSDLARLCLHQVAACACRQIVDDGRPQSRALLVEIQLPPSVRHAQRANVKQVLIGVGLDREHHLARRQRTALGVDPCRDARFGLPERR